MESLSLLAHQLGIFYRTFFSNFYKFFSFCLDLFIVCRFSEEKTFSSTAVVWIDVSLNSIVAGVSTAESLFYFPYRFSWANDGGGLEYIDYLMLTVQYDGKIKTTAYGPSLKPYTKFGKDGNQLTYRAVFQNTGQSMVGQLDVSFYFPLDITKYNVPPKNMVSALGFQILFIKTIETRNDEKTLKKPVAAKMVVCCMF